MHKTGTWLLLTVLTLAPSLNSFGAKASTPGMPLFFEANRGQTPGAATFVARGHNYQFLLFPGEAQIVLRKSDGKLGLTQGRGELPPRIAASTRALRMQILGGSSTASMSGENLMQGKMNYFIGNNPSQWRTRVPLYRRVQARNVYPKIDLSWYGNEQRLEYDFVVHPGASPQTIAIRFAGADKIRISPSGELVLQLGDEEIRQPAPTVYQFDGHARKTISGAYVLRSSNSIGFQIGEYNRELPLTIDPILSYSTYFGGNAGDAALSVKVSASDGSIYLAGETLSSSFPFSTPAGAFQPAFGGGAINGDAFVAKLDNTATELIYFTYVGGSGNDGALDLAIDGAGNAYITGFTESTNYPTFNALYPAISGSPDTNFHVFPADAFVTELSADGSALVYSTYLGGSAQDVAGAIAVDGSGNSYVTGYTFSTNFPTTSTCCDRLNGTRDVFVSKLGPNGQPLLYSSYLGGTNDDAGEGIAVDLAGFAYVTGYTASTNFPTTTNAMRRLLNGTALHSTLLDAFVAKIDTSVSTLGGPASLVYCTLLGGSNTDSGFRITLDGSANAYITGNTESRDFPNTLTNVPGLRLGANGTNAANSDAFITKLAFTSEGASIVYSGLFGGSKNDVGWDIAVDPSGNAFVTGVTASTNFPVTTNVSGLRTTNSGGNDAFVIGFNSDASALLYSTYLGGKTDDYGYGIAADAAGNAYVVGRTLSTNFPTLAASNSVFQTSRDGTNDAFIAKIVLEPVLTAQPAAANVALRWRAFTPDFVLEACTNSAAAIPWQTTTQLPVVTNGWHTVFIPPTNSSTLFRLRRQ